MKDFEKKLPDLRKIFQKNQVVLAYLFGSQVRGITGKLSDVDIAVLFDEKVFSRRSLDALLELIGDLKKSLKKENIDVIPLNNASPAMKYQAVILGRQIYTQDSKQAFEFEKKVLQEYEDTAFLRQVYYQHMKERIKNKKFGEFQYEK